MRSALLVLGVAVFGLMPAAARAQDTSQVTPVPPPAPIPAANYTAVRPGMSEADVRSRWGEPIVVKRINEWTFLFFRNYDETNVGFLDVVFLQNGQVVDAVVRGSEHIYLGQSSSPPNRTPEATPPAQRPDGASSGAVTGVRVTP